VSTYIDVDVVQ